jgi:ABC-2 type transport system permease protein
MSTTYAPSKTSAVSEVPTADRPPPSGPAVAHDRVTLPRVVRSEWIKFRTLRSSWLMLLAAVTAMVAIGAAVGYNTGKNWVGLAPEDAAPSGGLQGYLLAQLLVGVLGVLFVTGEYGTGMIRSTLAAVPRRVPVLLAKALVFSGVAVISMVSASLAGFASAQAFLSHYGHGTSLGDPGVLRVVIGTGIYLTLIGLLGGAIGWIVRNTAGGISTFLGLLLVLPLMVGLLPGSAVKDVAHYLPSNAGDSLVTSVHVPGTLTPWLGLVVLLAWVTGTLTVAAIQLSRKDA